MTKLIKRGFRTDFFYHCHLIKFVTNEMQIICLIQICILSGRLEVGCRMRDNGYGGLGVQRVDTVLLECL